MFSRAQISEKAPLVSQLTDQDKRWIVEVLVTVSCALNAADGVLLPACFEAFQTDLQALPGRLGMLSFYQGIAFALSLPVWAAATARFNMSDLLVLGVLLWGAATMALTFSFNFHVHCFLRIINGVGLCGVMPISQAMLAEVVPAEDRGKAFGRIAAFSAVAGMLTQYYALSLQSHSFHMGPLPVRGWQMVHAQIAVLALALAIAIYKYVPRALIATASGCSLAGIVQNIGRILRIPSFSMLVLQGVTGGVPWNAMAFMNLYWTTCGFTDEETGRIAVLAGIGSALGQLFSGYLGDAAAQRFPDRGRVFVAFSSVCLGIPCYVGIFYLVPRQGHWFWHAAALMFAFNLVSTWTCAAANKPICAELVRSPEQRAQIIAWWCMLEGATASILGAPLVGLLSEHFGYRLDASTRAVAPENSAALADALVGVGLVAWSCCALVWVGMAFTFPKDRDGSCMDINDIAKVAKSDYHTAGGQC